MFDQTRRQSQYFVNKPVLSKLSWESLLVFLVQANPDQDSFYLVETGFQDKMFLIMGDCRCVVPRRYIRHIVTFPVTNTLALYFFFSTLSELLHCHIQHFISFCFLCMSVLPAHIYMCTTCLTGVLGQKSVSDPLELEVQTVLSCPCGYWELNLASLGESSCCSQPLNQFSSPYLAISVGFSIPHYLIEWNRKCQKKFVTQYKLAFIKTDEVFEVKDQIPA